MTSKSEQASVGFIGVGQMGSAIARNVVRAGFQVFAFDTDGDRLKESQADGVQPVSSPRELAARSRTLVALLPDSGSLRKAVLGEGEGAINGMEADSVFINMGEQSLRVVLEVALALEEGKRGQMVDAPVSGTPDVARQAGLTVIASGQRAVVETCRPIFDATAKRVVYAGKLGNGTILKYLNNLLVAVNKLAAMEAAGLAMKAGIDMETFFETIVNSRGNSFQFDYHMKQVMAKNEENLARHTWHSKDLGLLSEFAESIDAPLFLGALGLQIVRSATNLSSEAREESTKTLIEFYEKVMGASILKRD